MALSFVPDQLPRNRRLYWERAAFVVLNPTRKPSQPSSRAAVQQFDGRAIILKAARRRQCFLRWITTSASSSCIDASIRQNCLSFWRSGTLAAHSITSSAIVSSLSGIVRPSAFAVLRLITSSNLVGCSTGGSPALAPLRIRSTYCATRRVMSDSLEP
jgi:hypothetical protein